MRANFTALSNAGFATLDVLQWGGSMERHRGKIADGVVRRVGTTRPTSSWAAWARLAARWGQRALPAVGQPGFYVAINSFSLPLNWASSVESCSACVADWP